ncbi:MAG: cytochrome C peroxidase [Bacteroidetes bacterium]|nr:MAG: cytochrome C peroxidase [Bacteroidota bacterium]PTM12140.1 MAG: cytochrome C peroxidase [Bacteroidota bacterium]
MMNPTNLACWGLFLTTLLLVACGGDDPTTCTNCADERIAGPYNPTTANLDWPGFLGMPIIPNNTPLTTEGIQLGRLLFYDPILSADSTMACASCHLQSKAFTDGLAKSVGVLGIATQRSSMSLVNLTLLRKDLFWDGHVNTLEEQALLPIEAHDELNDTWDNVEAKLRRHASYPQRFRAAFGIELKSEITRELAVQAIAQFERTLISGNSKFDQVVWANNGEFTEEEQLGKELFEVETAITLGHPGCTHCHSGPNFTDNLFHNNGLDDVASLNDFPDLGRGGVNNVIFDNGKFRTPSLRNVELTAPYMHDGRFATLEQVLDNYAAGGHGVENEDTNIRPFNLTPAERLALIAFLRTLTDTSFINNPSLSNPF